MSKLTQAPGKRTNIPHIEHETSKANNSQPAAFVRFVKDVRFTRLPTDTVDIATNTANSHFNDLFPNMHQIDHDKAMKAREEVMKFCAAAGRAIWKVGIPKHVTSDTGLFLPLASFSHRTNGGSQP